MRDLDLFQQALGLDEPWQVVGSDFDPERRRLDLRLDFRRGARFACPECGLADCAVHDTSEKTWRHLDFFQHEAYLTARVPRVECPEHGVRQVALPWARPGSGFTLLFEALVMALVREMPVRSVAKLVSEHDTRIWRVAPPLRRRGAGARGSLRGRADRRRRDERQARSGLRVDPRRPRPGQGDLRHRGPRGHGL